jgi:dual specificity phosphatase 12
MSKWNSFIYSSIQSFKSTFTVNLVNSITNNYDLIYICPHIYLGNVISSQDESLLLKYNIQSVINCSQDVPVHPYFKKKSFLQINIEDSKDEDNLQSFKDVIIKIIYFIDGKVNSKQNVLVHCYWGLMRSPTVIASYLIFKYNMDVDSAIAFIQSKKNFTFSNLYNFREILEYVHQYFHKPKEIS